MKIKKIIFGRCMLILSIFLAVSDSHSIPAGAPVSLSSPFQTGESLLFRVYWGPFPVGKVKLEIMPFTEISGERAYHFSMSARTNSFADIFYKVRDTIDSYTDAGMNHALRYTKVGSGKDKRNETVTFDWTHNIACYSSFDDKKSSIPVREGTFDPLSVFYAMRYFELKKGANIEVPVSDGKKSVIGRASVLGREFVQAGGVRYETFIVEAELGNISSVFKKSENSKIEIWVTADERHAPVYIKGKTYGGSFTAELITGIYEEE
ncbi:MAG: DUF3108 domain-containing protein [Syntrophales bacterium]|nr:DUF3108 domain-containing protein [Syntrophales bacterium]